MSEELHWKNDFDKPKRLVRLLLKYFDSESFGNLIGNSEVEFIEDGGMGSFKLIHDDIGKGSYAYIEASYRDSNGIDVLITLFLDESDNVSQVDLWKEDFSKLVDFPSGNEVHDIKRVCPGSGDLTPN